MGNEYAIEGVGLEKTFNVRRPAREVVLHPFQRERTRALRGVDIRVRRGEVFGLLGPNGAGKTTLLKIFSCLVLPDGGTAKVDGIETLDENRVKPRIGLINSDERSFYWRLTGRQNLRFFARIYDVPSARIASRIDELLERVEMSDAADRSFSTYSSGMKQRMSVARALLHDPPILFMDEPTRSLDPASSLHLRQFVQNELNVRDGKTILLATHNLAEAQALSHRIAILVKGRVRQVGTVDEVRRWGIDERLFRLELGASLDGVSGPFRVVKTEEIEGVPTVTIALDPGAELDDLLRVLLAARVPIRACDRVDPDLEGAFSRILESESADEPEGVAMIRNLLKVWAFITRDFISQISYRLSFVMQVGGMFLGILAFYYMAGMINPESEGFDGARPFDWLIIGLSFQFYFSQALYAFSAKIRSEQMLGTLEAMLVSPTPTSMVVFSSAAWDFAWGGIRILIYMLFATLVFGVKLHATGLGALAVGVVLTLLSSAGLGILSASFILYFKRGDPINFLLSGTTTFLGSVFFPVEQLPEWIRPASEVLPITWSLRVVRGSLLHGENLFDLQGELLRLALLTVILLPAGLFCSRFAIRRAKREGSLVQY